MLYLYSQNNCIAMSVRAFSNTDIKYIRIVGREL
ncbi:hypothetical protein J2Z25_001423 [Clostridium tertium]|jgi:hypothetical protein|nr:hypothetical protein [Clostridium tertium]